MANNSNQTGALMLIALVLGSAVAALMFFGSEMEQTNVSASFGNLAKESTSKSIFKAKKSIASDFSAAEIRSDLSGVTLPAHKMKSTSGGDYAQYSSPDFISSSVMQVDVQSMNNSHSGIRTNTKVNYASNYSQSLMIGNSAVEYISNPQNPTKADIAGLLLLDTRAAEVAMTSQQGSKRATPALNGKTAAVSTSLTNDKDARKVDGGGSPGDPNPGGSLPIGEGIWTMLLLASFYSSKNLKWFRK